MKTIHTIVVIAFATVLLTVDCYAQNGELAQDCDGQVSRQPPYVALSCSGWFIRVYTPSGKKWGRISGKTRAEVVQELERSRRLDHKVAPNLQSNPNHLSYDYPSEPICEMCDPRAARVKPPWSAFCSNPSIADAADVRKSYLCTGALRDLEDWGGRVRRTIPGLLGKLEGPNPFGDVFTVVGPYLTSLADAMRRVNDLREKVKSATDWTEIDRGLGELRHEMERSNQEYDRLPSNVRAWLEDKYSVSVNGLWLGPEWRDGTHQGLKIVQVGNSLRIYEPGSGRFLFQGTLNGGDFTTSTQRIPTELTSDQVRACGLSSNILFSNVSLKATIAADGKSFTLQQITEKVEAGGCVFGGTIDVGTFYKQ